MRENEYQDENFPSYSDCEFVVVTIQVGKLEPFILQSPMVSDFGSHITTGQFLAQGKLNNLLENVAESTVKIMKEKYHSNCRDNVEWPYGVGE